MSSNPSRRMRRQKTKESPQVHRNGHGIMFPPQQQAAAVQVAAPLNDVQLVALVAAQLLSGDMAAGDRGQPAAVMTNRDAVESAVDLVARSARAVQGGALHNRLQALLAAQGPDPAA